MGEWAGEPETGESVPGCRGAGQGSAMGSHGRTGQGHVWHCTEIWGPSTACIP